MIELTKKEINYYEELGNKYGWVAPLTDEDREYYALFRQMLKHYNIIPSKATKLEYDFVIKATETEFFAGNSKEQNISSRHATLDEILKKEREYYQSNGNKLVFVVPGSVEEQKFFSYLHAVFGRYNIDPEKATRLEFDFVIRVAECEYYMQFAIA